MNQNNTQKTTYPEWLDRGEFPFESHYFETPHGKMHYVDEGQGEPIVMMHGNPGWSFEFRETIKGLSNTNRCIAPDYIGFGLSEKPWGFDYLPSSHAAYIETFLDSLNLDNIRLVVNDWGGPVGLSYALKHPGKIKQLIILNTWMWPVDDDPHFIRFSKFMGGKFGRFLILNFNFFGKQVVKMAVGNKKMLSKNVHRHYFRHMATRKERLGSHIFPRQIVKSADWLRSLWEQHEKINHIPTTFIWGMKDIAFKEKELAFWIKHWKGPKVIKLENIGHFPQEEAPEVLIRELK